MLARGLRVVHSVQPSIKVETIMESPRAEEPIRLYCFAHAGAQAMVFRAWQEALPPHVRVRPVELPGRGMKAHQAPVYDYRLLVEELSEEICDELISTVHGRRIRYAIFGHSAGGRFGFGVASRVTHATGAGPEHFFVSGCRPPMHMPLGLSATPRTRDEWIEQMRRWGATPEELLQDPELADILIGRLRSDMAAHEGVHVDRNRRLHCNMTLFAAAQDAQVSLDEVWAWQHFTTGRSRLVAFQGSHFAIVRDPGLALAVIGNTLSAPAADGIEESDATQLAWC